MNDELDKLLSDMEGPLPDDANSFLLGFQGGTLAIQRATVDVPNDVLALDNLSFSFDTNIGLFVFPYTHKLNGRLLRLGVVMDSPDKESVRMGQLLLDNLRLPDVQFGKDYTNAVLWSVVNERLGHVPLIRQTLDSLSHHGPYGGASLVNCTRYLRDQIAGIGNSIVLELRYQEPRAFAIFAGAVYYVLDRRHRISERRALFPR